MDQCSDKHNRTIKEPESSRAASTDINPWGGDQVSVHTRARLFLSTEGPIRDAGNDAAPGTDSCLPADYICGRRRFRRYRQDRFFFKILGDCGSVKTWFLRIGADMIHRNVHLIVPPERANAKGADMAETP
jgi:hypothetical protein